MLECLGKEGNYDLLIKFFYLLISFLVFKMKYLCVVDRFVGILWLCVFFLWNGSDVYDIVYLG